MDKIDELLQKLGALTKNELVTGYFNPGISAARIESIQKENGFRIPLSYYKFLRQHNGGFISLISKSIDNETMAWNSNTFLGIEEIEDAYKRISYKFDHYDKEVFVPFLHTSDGEYLGFFNPLKENESIVYDLWHESFPGEWLQMAVYDSFSSLLEDYINNHGIINTMG